MGPVRPRLLAPSPTTPLVSLSLLVLRGWFGILMLNFHGLAKLQDFSALSQRFSDPLGVGQPLSLALAIGAELVCAGLIAAGLATRLAAAVLVVNMATAFVTAHGARLSGQGNGELAFLYLGAFLTLVVAGAGRYSLDQVLFGTRR